MKRLSFKDFNLKKLIPQKLFGLNLWGNTQEKQPESSPLRQSMSPTSLAIKASKGGRKIREYRKRRKHKNAMAALSRRINWGIC